MERESKKLVLWRVLHILEYYSDCNHPLTQDDIMKYLEKDYGIVVERKAVGRQLSLLREAYDYPDSPITIITEKRKSANLTTANCGCLSTAFCRVNILRQDTLKSLLTSFADCLTNISVPT